MFRTFWLGKWWILGSIAASAAAGAVGTMVWTYQPPHYDAVALLRVQPPASSRMSTRREWPSDDLAARRINDHVKCILREQVLKAAVQKETICRSSWYLKQDKAKVIENLLACLTVSPVKDTFLIEVRMSGPADNYEDRAALANIATAVAQAYADICTEEASMGRRAQITLLQAELKALESAPANPADAEFTRSLRHKVQETLMELQLLDRGEESEIRLACLAEVPMAPAAPAWRALVPKAALLGALAGLLLGLILAFGRQSLPPLGRPAQVVKPAE